MSEGNPLFALGVIRKELDAAEKDLRLNLEAQLTCHQRHAQFAQESVERAAFRVSILKQALEQLSAYVAFHERQNES